MELSRPRPSILSLFDPLSSELDRATSPDSDKENDTSDFFKPSGTTLKHVYVSSRTLKRRLVDVGDITVEQPDMNSLLSDELEQEISYIVDDDENDTLTFRDMAKAATPKWSSRHTTPLETSKVLSPRTPLSEISLKDELTPLARKKPYKRQLVPTTPKGSESTCLVFPSSISSCSSSSCPPSYTGVPEVRVNDEPVPPSSSIPANSLGDSSESLFPRTLNQSIPVETLATGTLSSSLVAPAPCPAQPRTRHLSPTSTDNANRYSVDLQTSFQIHFPSHDTTFDLLKDKIPFFGSRNEFDSYLNDLEGDSSFDDDILIPGSGSKIEKDSGVSSTTTLNQVQSVVKSDKLIDHPTPLSKDVGFTEPSMASHTHVDTLSLVQPSISDQPSLVGDTKANQATFVQPHVFHPPLPLVVDGARPMSTPVVDNPRYLPPQIPALRIVKRSKTINQQKPGLMTKDGPSQDALIPLRCRVPPVTEAPASSSLTTITKKGPPSEVSQRTDRAHFLPSLASNGPRRVLISEGPKLNLTMTSEQVKPSSTCGPRRVAMTVPSTIMERASSSARPPPVQPSSGLRQPVKRTGVVKPVQRTAGSRLPAMTRRIGGSGTSGEILPSRRVI